jgi:DNA-binding CsgD family transcriptional regulator/ArsR family metal-binding transcriptional regulator
LDWDISPLFPYLNAVARSAQLYSKPAYIKFVLDGRLCAFYPSKGAFAPVADLVEAYEFLNTLSEYIAGIIRDRESITPVFKTFKTVSPLDIYRLLPGTNCRKCGHATCLAFAAALSRQKASADHCPYLLPPVEEQATFPVLDHKGNCIRTISLAIDTTQLRSDIHRKDARIQDLEGQLADFESHHQNDFHTANTNLPTPLTNREIQVLRRLSQGATNKEISLDLHISEHTVKSHVIHIFNKLAVNDRTQASVWAVSHGLL